MDQQNRWYKELVDLLKMGPLRARRLPPTLNTDTGCHACTGLVTSQPRIQAHAWQARGQNTAGFSITVVKIVFQSEKTLTPQSSLHSNVCTLTPQSSLNSNVRTLTPQSSLSSNVSKLTPQSSIYWGSGHTPQYPLSDHLGTAEAPVPKGMSENAGQCLSKSARMEPIIGRGIQLRTKGKETASSMTTESTTEALHWSINRRALVRGSPCARSGACMCGLQCVVGMPTLYIEGNERAVRTVLCAVRARCSRFGARCFINPPFFHLVTAGCKHHSPTSISRACGRAAGSKICDHPPPSARGGTLETVAPDDDGCGVVSPAPQKPRC